MKAYSEIMVVVLTVENILKKMKSLKNFQDRLE